MKLDDFDYELPPELVAAMPAGERDLARLLVHEVGANETRHARVRDLPDLLAPGDLVVLNDTRVRPARLFGTRQSGGAVELLLVERLGEVWRARANPARKLKPGERIELEDGAHAVPLERPEEGGAPDPAWILRLEIPGGASEEAWLERRGRMPLPPYIDRARGVDRKHPGSDAQTAHDRERYQTVFARAPGAVAAPTAGLHFTRELFGRIRTAGVEIAFVTLHVGEGTFQPVKVDDVRTHRMHAERYELPEETASAVLRTREVGGRVIAVGTTSVRVLESAAEASREGSMRPGSGETSLFLYPGRPLRAVDGLLTNFHLPKSTLLMLVAAFAGLDRVQELYREAIERRYRFFSYGDAMLLLH